MSKETCYNTGPTNTPPASYVWNEGDVEVPPGPYQIPYYVILPEESEASNFFSISALSASHIGLSTLRMEPQFMIIGHSAGVAAALAINTTNSSLHSINMSTLSLLLINDGQLL